MPTAHVDTFARDNLPPASDGSKTPKAAETWK